MEKIREITIKTPKGERVLRYQKPSSIPENTQVCNVCCPYGRACIHLRDPRDPENESKTFNSFCAALGKEGSECEESDFMSMVPVDGTIEDALPDHLDVIQQIIAKNPVVRVSDIIERFCKGWCEMYTDDRSNCKSSNKMCVLHNLFDGPADVIEIEPYDPDIEMLEELDRQRAEKEKENA